MTHHFTPEYEEAARLRDGSIVRLRLVRPDDRELLRRGFEEWSAPSRFARFLAPKQALSEEELTYLCDLDQETHFGIGALVDVDGTPTGAGIARFIRLPYQLGEPVTAEAAIAVADAMQGKGLGKLLLLRLLAAAAERGVEQFRCELLADNKSMQALIAAIAPQHTSAAHGGTLTIDFPVGDVPPDASPDGHSQGPLYEILRAAAGSVRRIWKRGSSDS